MGNGGNESLNKSEPRRLTGFALLLSYLKDATAVVTATIPIFGLLWAVFNETIKANVRDLAGYDDLSAQIEVIKRRGILAEMQPCLIVPAFGHSATDAAPGQWAQVEWSKLVRPRPGCGLPTLRGVVINGDGLEHDAELSISGRLLPIGIPQDVKYQFRVPESAQPGDAELFVYTVFPQAKGGAPDAIAGPVPFEILLQPSQESAP